MKTLKQQLQDRVLLQNPPLIVSEIIEEVKEWLEQKRQKYNVITIDELVKELDQCNAEALP